jgi:hypothetical protein
LFHPPLQVGSSAIAVKSAQRVLASAVCAEGGEPLWCAGGTLFGVTMWRRAWKSRSNLWIGDAVSRLRRLYPGSTHRPNGWWRLHRGGSRVATGGLFARVNDGRVDEFWVQ